nr:hypothetical protein CFP56_04295 [Quercus suber]
MSVLLEIRLPLSTLPALRNSEDIEDCLGGLLVDYDSSMAAAAINDITKAALSSVKALPCNILTRDDAGQVLSLTNRSTSCSNVHPSVVAPNPAASSYIRVPGVPGGECVQVKNSNEGWGCRSRSVPAAIEIDDGGTSCDCRDPKDHYSFHITIRDAMLRSERFQVGNCSTVRELAALWAGLYHTPSDPEEYAWAVHVEGHFTRCLAIEDLDSRLSVVRLIPLIQRLCDLTDILMGQIIEDNTTFVLSRALDIDITVCDAMGRQNSYLLRDTELFRWFRELWFRDAQIGNGVVQFHVDGNVIDHNKDAGKTLKELGFYNNVKVQVTLRTQPDAQRILIHITDGERLKCILDLSNYETLDDLSRAYKGQVKYAPANISFVFAGNRLDGSSVTLQEFGILDGATVMVIHGPTNGMTDYNIVFKDAMNAQCTLKFRVTDTYLDLVDRYAKVVGLPAQNLLLKHNRVFLGAEVMKPLHEFAKASSINDFSNPMCAASAAGQFRFPNNSFVRGSVSADDVWAASHASEADDWE